MSSLSDGVMILEGHMTIPEYFLTRTLSTGTCY